MGHRAVHDVAVEQPRTAVGSDVVVIGPGDGGRSRWDLAWAAVMCVIAGVTVAIGDGWSLVVVPLIALRATWHWWTGPHDLVTATDWLLLVPPGSGWAGTTRSREAVADVRVRTRRWGWHTVEVVSRTGEVGPLPLGSWRRRVVEERVRRLRAWAGPDELAAR